MSPVTVQLVPAAPVVQDAPPGVAVTVYPVIGDVPELTGADQETVTAPFPSDVDRLVGAPGAAGVGIGVTADDGVDGSPAPAAFRATTAKRWATPFVRPVTVHVRVTPTRQPGIDVGDPAPSRTTTSYPVMGDPPLKRVADHDTVALASPGTAVTVKGGNGTLRGVADTPVEATLVPIALVAVTVNEYGKPLVSPVNTHDVVVVVHVTGPGVAVTVYDWMFDPLLSGATQVTSTTPVAGPNG